MSLVRLAAAVALISCGCVVGEPVPVPMAYCPTRQAIVNGMSEPDHPAVVALLDREGTVACTGTIVDQRDTVAFVLTAAHCAGGAVAAGQPGASARRFPILFVASSGSADLAVAAIQVPDRPLDRIALLDPADDDLAQGDPVLIVGYGRDQTGRLSSDRRSVWANISHLNDEAFAYGQACGGPCGGDSGGPALVRRDDGWRVAGITARGDPACLVDGESVRASLHTRFIAQVLALPRDVIALQERAAEQEIVLHSFPGLEVIPGRAGGGSPDEKSDP